YTTSSVAASAFDSIAINAAHLAGNQTVSVVVQVLNSATVGEVTYTGPGAGAIGASAVTLEIAGNAGTQQLSFAGSSTLASVATALNNIKDVTGVSALVSGQVLRYDSTGYGSEQYVSVKSISGTFAVSNAGKDFGTDATVTVNGAAAQAAGKTVTYRSSGLD